MTLTKALVLAACMMTGPTFLAAPPAAVQPTPDAGTVVALLEPVKHPESPQRAYSVSVGGHKFIDGREILDALGEAHGSRLVMLVRDSVPVSIVCGLAASASKAGYTDYSVYVFDEQKTWMMAIPSFRTSKFSLAVNE